MPHAFWMSKSTSIVRVLLTVSYVIMLSSFRHFSKNDLSSFHLASLSIRLSGNNAFMYLLFAARLIVCMVCLLAVKAASLVTAFSPHMASAQPLKQVRSLLCNNLLRAHPLANLTLMWPIVVLLHCFLMVVRYFQNLWQLSLLNCRM